ncbi:MAG: hypothetical protein LH466_08355, partial [Sphingomonas bacterium]|nr:hypothetical protein [Sphingomonas bacterium]
ATVAMANKAARVIWAIMTRGETYRSGHMPVLAAGADQPSVGQPLLHERALDGVERMKVQHRLDPRPAIGQRQHFVLICLVRLICIAQHEGAAWRASHRHLRANVDDMEDPEIAAYVPEIASKTFHRCAPEKLD